MYYVVNREREVYCAVENGDKAEKIRSFIRTVLERGNYMVTSTFTPPSTWTNISRDIELKYKGYKYLKRHDYAHPTFNGLWCKKCEEENTSGAFYFAFDGCGEDLLKYVGLGYTSCIPRYCPMHMTKENPTARNSDIFKNILMGFLWDDYIPPGYEIYKLKFGPDSDVTMVTVTIDGCEVTPPIRIPITELTKSRCVMAVEVVDTSILTRGDYNTCQTFLLDTDQSNGKKIGYENVHEVLFSNTSLKTKKYKIRVTEQTENEVTYIIESVMGGDDVYRELAENPLQYREMRWNVRNSSQPRIINMVECTTLPSNINIYAYDPRLGRII